MEELKTKYITADDFKMYFGIDLDNQYRDDDNPSNKVNAFLYRVETRLATYLDSHFYRKIDKEYPKFSNYQKEHYKLALLEQAMYVLRNSDISNDSGYDPEKGVIASKNQLEERIICPNCKDHLMLCGLWCRKVQTRSRIGLYNDGWLY